MRIKSLIWRNLYCYGNDNTVITFTDGGSLNQIIGTNGVGKTTIMKILKFLSYFETEGVTIRAIANDINGNGYGEINIQSNDGTNWRICANITSELDIAVYKNDSEKPEDWGGLNDTKKKIRTLISTIPYHIFSNIISLSIHDFKSFLSMKAADSRNIRDKIFSFMTVNEMSESINIKLNENSRRFETVQNQKISLESLLVNYKSSLNEALINFEKTKQEKLLSLNENLIKDTDNHKVLTDKISYLQGQLDLWKEYEQYEQYEQLLSSIEISNKELVVISDELESTRTKIEESEKSLAHIESLKKQIVEYKRYETYTNQLRTKERLTEEIKQSQLSLDSMIIRRDKLASSIESYNLDSKSLKEYQNKLETLKTRKFDYDTRQIIEDEIKSINDDIKKCNDNSLKYQESETRATLKSESLIKRKKLLEEGKCSKCGTEFKDAESELKILDIELQELNVKWDNLKKATSANKSKLEASSRLLNEKSKLLKNLYNGDKIEESEISDCETHVLELSSRIELFDTSFIKEYDKLKNDISEIDSSIKIKQGNLQALVDIEEVSKVEKPIFDIIKLDESEREHKRDLANNRDILQTKQTRLGRLQSEIETKSDRLSAYTNTMKVEKPTGSSISEIKSEINSVDLSINKTNKEIIKTQTEIDSTTKLENTVAREYENLIKKTELEINDFESVFNELKSEFYHLKSLSYLCSDEGIKSFILKDMIPSINLEIAKVIEYVGIKLALEFDNEFKTHIYRNGKEVQLKSISKGQGDILNCATIFALTKVLKMKYGNFNVVFYDEIFSSLAADKRPLMLQLLQRMSEEMDLQIFVVNHSYLPSQIFDKIYHIEEQNGFSRLNIMNVDDYELYRQEQAKKQERYEEVG